MQLWRGRMMAQIPESLWARLREARHAGHISRLSSKSLAAIGRALQDGELLRGEVECCPNCGHTLRVRPDIGRAAIKIMAEWLTEQKAREP
jgi:hypothetical protein